MRVSVCVTISHAHLRTTSIWVSRSLSLPGGGAGGVVEAVRGGGAGGVGSGGPVARHEVGTAS